MDIQSNLWFWGGGSVVGVGKEMEKRECVENSLTTPNFNQVKEWNRESAYWGRECLIKYSRQNVQCTWFLLKYVLREFNES